MGALAHLETRLISVEPGSQAAAQIRVRNTGTIVDGFTIEVLGDAQPWATAVPPTLSLFPAAEQVATITFAPPRSPQVPAGQMPFGIRVLSKEDPAGSVVEEGVLDIAPFSEVSAELAPRTSRGSRHATHDLAVDNRGNAPLNATITAADPDKQLAFEVRPPSIVADPGVAAFAKVGVTPRHRFWRGPSKTRSFRVLVESPGVAPVGVDGSMLQEAILPPWTLRALLAALVVAVIAVALWFALLKPAIESTAKQQANQQLIAAGATTDPNGNVVIPGLTPHIGPSAPAPPPTAAPPSGAPSGAPSAGPPTLPPPSGSSPIPSITAAPPTAGGGPFAGLGTPVTDRLDAGQSTKVEPGKTLYVTDLFFSNPTDGSSGPVVLYRGNLAVITLDQANFRDIDYHWVTPLTVTSDAQMRLDCSGTCKQVAVTYSGYQP